MGSEIETVEQRLKSFTSQLETECGILERLVYKHKNQQRRCSYFQYVLKVRRDLKLLKSANLVEILDACFLVINGNRPKQKVQLLESLKRRKSNGGKYNFLERLLGVTRLLSQMVEPLLKAAMELSPLLARAFFAKFSLTTLAVLARIRVQIQQILLDAVYVYNTVSSLSRSEQTVKLNLQGFEVFREYYPTKEEAYVILECVWQKDKFIQVEKTHCEDNDKEKKDQEDASLKAANILYENIEVILGVDDSGKRKAEHIPENPTNTEENDPMKLVDDTTDRIIASTADSALLEKANADSSTVTFSELNCGSSIKEGPCIEAQDQETVSLEAHLSSSSSQLSDSNRVTLTKNTKNKVAFVPVKPRAPSTANDLRPRLNGTEKNAEKKEDKFFNLLTGGAMNSLF